MNTTTSRSAPIIAQRDNSQLTDSVRLWQHVHGDRPDLLAVFTGQRQGDALIETQTRYYTPDQLGNAAAYADAEARAGHEVFWCAHQLLTQRRKKEHAAPVTCLYADVDTGDFGLAPFPPTAVVQSSPGRTQAYWRLTRPIAPALAEALNKRLARCIGADPSGADLTQVLRAPGTRNHKYVDAPEVRLAFLDDDGAYEPEDFERELPDLQKDGPARTASLAALADVSDGDLINKMLNASNGATIRALWCGDIGAYSGDESSADLALMNHLAWWTNSDPSRMEAMFGASALGARDKWVDRADYRERTIQKAIAGCNGGYSPDRQNDILAMPAHQVGDGHCAHCEPLHAAIAEAKRQIRVHAERSARRAELFRKPKDELDASEKLMADALLNEQASRESRGIDGPMAVTIEREEDPDHPERADWTDNTLAGRLGMSGSTASRALKRLTDENVGLWSKVYETVYENGLRRTRLALAPRDGLDADNLWYEAVKFQPPADADGTPKPRSKRPQCKHHPTALITHRKTWNCSICGREAAPPKEKLIDPFGDTPDLQNDSLVTGEAIPADPSELPADQFADPGDAVNAGAAVRSVDVTNGRQIDALERCQHCGAPLQPDDREADSGWCNLCVRLLDAVA